MTLKTIITDVCRRIGQATPQSVVGSADQTISQLLGLANEEGQELASRFRWQAIVRQGSFTTLAQEDQGALAILAPWCDSIINDTLWDSASRSPIMGSIAAARWQIAHARTWMGMFYRIRGGRLLMSPAPPAGVTVTFEYASRAWVLSSDGATYRSAWASDDDNGLIDETLMISGLVWRWKQVKGFEYAEDFAKYERRVMDAETRDVPHSVQTSADPSYGMPGQYALGGISISVPAEAPVEPGTPPPIDPGTPPVPAGTVYSDFSVRMLTAPQNPNDDDIVTFGMIKSYVLTGAGA